MKIFPFIIVLAFLLSCSSDEPELDKVDYENITLKCLIQEGTEFIIESEDEYIQMATQIYDAQWGPNCADTTQAPFDFNEYVLIGKYSKLDTNDELSIEVLEDKKQKRIIYSMDIDYVPGPDNNGGFGNIYLTGMNWVKIQKPSDDYTIEIEYY